MAAPLTEALLIAATLLHGFLAGGNVERALVHMPAWRKLGPRAWAAFSRQADLGRGLFLYPFEAILGAALAVGAALAFQFDPAASRAAALPLYLGAALALAGLLATTQAAPKMLSLRRLADDDLPALQRAFHGFERWGNVRAVFQVLAFLANVWALAVLARGLG
jgi:hypothetical protein